MQRIICNKCGAEFSAGRSDILTLADGEIEVQYFTCPKCSWRYQVLTTDAEFRELIERRKKLTKQIRMAHVKKFREKVIRGYEQKLADIESLQKQSRQRLKRRGEELLGNSDRKEETDGTL